MSEVFIAGVGMTRFGPQPDESVKSLAAHCIGDSLADCGAEARQVQAVFFAKALHGVLEGQVSIPGQIVLQDFGLQGLPIINVKNACASGGTAFWLARNHVLGGQADIVVAVGAEKTALESAKQRMHVMHLYAQTCRAHMAKFDTKQLQLAIIASKNHSNAALNPRCHYNQPLSVEEILAARPLGFPLTEPMCCPLTDGGAAAVLCNRRGLTKLQAASRAIRVDSCVLISCLKSNWKDFENYAVRRAAFMAYARAGIGPEDVDVAEVHDAAAFGELFMTELLGFCELGGGGALAESRTTHLGGTLPVNPSGGLESKGHPMGATGLGQIFELVTQLRQEAGSRQVEYARVAVQENGGGMRDVGEDAAVVTVLSR